MYERGFTNEQIKHLSRRLKSWMCIDKQDEGGAAEIISGYISEITKKEYDISKEFMKLYLNKVNKTVNNFGVHDYLIYRFLDNTGTLNRPLFMHLGGVYFRQLAMTLATYIDASFDNSHLDGKFVSRSGDFILDKNKFSLFRVALTNNVSRGGWRENISVRETIAFFHPESVIGPNIDGRKINPGAIGIVKNAKEKPKGIISLSGTTPNFAKMLRPVDLRIVNGNLSSKRLHAAGHKESCFSAPNKANIDIANDNMYTERMYELVNKNIDLYEEEKRKNSPVEVLAYYAILAGNNYDAKNLIDNLSNINIRIQSLGNETLLHVAARNENFEILDALLRRKEIDVEITDDECLVAWDHAFMWGDRNKLIKRYGANFSKFTQPAWKRALSRLTRPFH